MISISQELKDQIIGNLVRAIDLLQECKNLSEFIPEVRMNLAYCLPNAKSVEDVAAIPGRISTYKDQIIVSRYPAFGGSDHLARALIEAQKYDESIRSVINFKYTKQIRHFLEQYVKKENLSMVCVDRTEEPISASDIDGHSMPWKIKHAVELSQNEIPDIIGETESLGKEPLFKLFGKSAVDVAEKLIKIANAWAEKN